MEGILNYSDSEASCDLSDKEGSDPRRDVEDDSLSVGSDECYGLGLKTTPGRANAGGQFWSEDERQYLDSISDQTLDSIPNHAQWETQSNERKRRLVDCEPTWSQQCEEEIAAAAPLASAKKLVLDTRCSQDIPSVSPKADTHKIFYVHHRVSPFIGRCLPRRVPSKVRQSIHAHAGPVNRIKWCERAEYSHLLASVSMDTTVKIWNLLTVGAGNRCLLTLANHSKAVKDVNWTGTGDRILTCGYDRSALFQDVETGAVVQRCQLADFLLCNAIRPTDGSVALVGGNSKVYLLDFRLPLSEPAKQYSHKDKFGQVQDVLFDRHGTLFFSSGDAVSRESADRSIMAWDTRTGSVLSNQMYQEHYTCVRMKLHPTEPVLFAQTSGNYVALFSDQRPFKMNKRKRYEFHRVDGYAVGFDISLDGSLVVSGSADGELYAYDCPSSRQVSVLDNGWGMGVACLDVAFHPLLESAIATSSWGGQINLWT